jgi:glucan phosphorylase
MVDSEKTRVVYFSMEIALDSRILTYSGGLGILAGDMLPSAADLGVPMVAVTLVHRKGYFHQRLDDRGNPICCSIHSRRAPPWKSREGRYPSGPGNFHCKASRRTLSDRTPPAAQILYASTIPLEDNGPPELNAGSDLVLPLARMKPTKLFLFRYRINTQRQRQLLFKRGLDRIVRAALALCPACQ